MSSETGKRFMEARKHLSRNNLEESEESIQSVHRGTGIPASSISLYENGRMPNTKNAKILADYYGVNVSWLLGQSDSPSLDEDSQVVTKLTGLSADVVDWLQSVKHNPVLLACVNALLSSQVFRGALQTIALAMVLSERNTQDDETAQMIERANLFRASHEGDDNAPYRIDPPNTVSNRQLIRMYRSDALLDVGNAFRDIAPADDSEKGEDR